ncbi:MAG TPA: hypothetical protein VMF86_00215 [Stellaceae bacterium]|nr:hypothetical protein [Stellaceae bacterium]
MDTYDLLRPVGYRTGKLTPDGVLFRDYRVEHVSQRRSRRW